MRLWGSWFFMLVFMLSFSSADGSGTVEVDVDVMGDIVSIQVPENVYLGNVSRGFRTDEARIDVINNGNTNIRMTARRESGDSLFDYLYFSKRITGEDANFRRIESFSLDISRPSSIGGTKSEYFYVRLDLTNYTTSLDPGLNRKSADVKFIATQN